MKVLITRSQVAQLYVELTNDNLKESFIVEGDEVVEFEEAPAAQETSSEEIPTESTVETQESAETPAESTPETEAPAA